MPQRVYKYVLSEGSYPAETQILIPKDATYLTVQVQDGQLCLWAQVDPLKAVLPCKFRILYTGAELPREEDLRYLSTVQIERRTLHIFEVLRTREV